MRNLSPIFLTHSKEYIFHSAELYRSVSHSGLLENEKSELKEVKAYVSIGVHLHISRTAWLMYVTRKLPSGTRQRYRKKKLVVAVIMFPGQRVLLIHYLETLEKVRITVYQLKVGHKVVGTFLVRIRVIETPEC